MGKKMKLPFLSSSKSLDPTKLSSSSSLSPPPWPFPSCGNIKTQSFRVNDDNDDAFRTFNSAFLEAEVTPPESPSSRSFWTMSEEDLGDPLESVIRGLRMSDRLFFDPEQSSSLLVRKQEQEQEQHSSSSISPAAVLESTVADDVLDTKVAYKESEILSMDSSSPYEDFRRSMEEMVEAHGLKDWQALEELLGCYLKINGKNNHGYIIGAFIDLLVSLSFSDESTSTSIRTTITTTTTTTTTTSSSYSTYSSPSSPFSLPSSSLTTPCLSSVLDLGDDEHDDGVHDDDDHVSC